MCKDDEIRFRHMLDAAEDLPGLISLIETVINLDKDPPP